MSDTGKPNGKAPFRFQGSEVFTDIKTQTPRIVPDADSDLLTKYQQQMDRLFRSRRLPAVIYKGATIPARDLGELI